MRKLTVKENNWLTQNYIVSIKAKIGTQDPNLILSTLKSDLVNEKTKAEFFFIWFFLFRILSQVVQRVIFWSCFSQNGTSSESGISWDILEAKLCLILLKLRTAIISKFILLKQNGNIDSELMGWHFLNKGCVPFIEEVGGQGLN